MVDTSNPYRMEFGGPADGPRLILVHGLGGSHVNWARLGPLLAGFARPVAVDLGGFGLTPGRGRAVSIAANVALLTRFVEEEANRGAILVGNSMGGLVSLLTAAAAPDAIRAIALFDPAVPGPAGVALDPAIRKQFVGLILPLLAVRALRTRAATVPAERRVADTLAACGITAGDLPADYLAQEIAMTERRGLNPDAIPAYVSATRSMIRTLAGARRFWSKAATVTCPVLLAHGDQDRIIPYGFAQAAAERFSAWDFRTLTGVGHAPQIEIPEQTAELLRGWIEALPQ